MFKNANNHYVSDGIYQHFLRVYASKHGGASVSAANQHYEQTANNRGLQYIATRRSRPTTPASNSKPTTAGTMEPRRRLSFSLLNHAQINTVNPPSGPRAFNGNEDNQNRTATSACRSHLSAALARR